MRADRIARWRRSRRALVVAPMALALAIAPAVADATSRALDGWAVLAQVDGVELPEPAQPPEEVRERADEILERPEFRPRERSAIQRAIDWILRRLGEALSRGASTGGGLLGWLLLVGLIAGAVWVVRRIQPVPRAPTAREDIAVMVEEARSAGEWRAAAAAHEASGAWLEALRCHYQALVAELVEREVVDDIPGRTVGEYRAELAAARPAATPAFVDATTVYEDAWYGTGDASSADTHRFVAGASRVLEEVGR
jgi:hypothetical protein